MNLDETKVVLIAIVIAVVSVVISEVAHRLTDKNRRSSIDNSILGVKGTISTKK